MRKYTYKKFGDGCGGESWLIIETVNLYFINLY